MDLRICLEVFQFSTFFLSNIRNILFLGRILRSIPFLDTEKKEHAFGLPFLQHFPVP